MIITTETFFDEECRAVNLLFENGMERLHVRKPFASPNDYECFVRRIKETYRPRLVLHHCYELANRFALRGIHLNRRSERMPENDRLTVSRSCHTFKEVLMCREDCDYVFLSPIFDSVSKTGYNGKFTKADGIIDERVIALGGIVENRVEEIRRYGFGGVALIGALWKKFLSDGGDSDALLERFKALKTQCDER